MMEIPERFWTKVVINDCWEWTASNSDGYGHFWFDGRIHKSYRWLYERLVGPIPAEMVPDHQCRNHSCVNPDHLRIVTNRVNVLAGESVVAKNARKDRCNNGHSYTEANTAWVTRPNGARYRRCRECNRADCRAKWQRKQAKALALRGES